MTWSCIYRLSFGREWFENGLTHRGLFLFFASQCALQVYHCNHGGRGRGFCAHWHCNQRFRLL
jgi:hypothetical protein